MRICSHERFRTLPIPAWRLEDERKRLQEVNLLLKVGDFFKKCVVVDGSREPWADEDGIVYVGIIPFLLRPEILE